MSAVPKDPYVWALEVVDKVGRTVQIEEVVRRDLAVDILTWVRMHEDKELAADCVNRCVATRPAGQDVAGLLHSAQEVYKIASEHREKPLPGKPAGSRSGKSEPRRSRAAERSAKRT